MVTKGLAKLKKGRLHDFSKRAKIQKKNKKKTARTSQKEEEVGELPRATEVTGGRRSFQA